MELVCNFLKKCNLRCRMLSFFVTAGVLVGFDASGHVAEETKNASLVAARGVFYSALASGIMGFPMVILFLFCTPNLDTLYSFDSPQPFVNLYALALGQNAHCVMNTVAILGLVLNTSVAVIAASRLIFAIARDGVLPLSGWIAQVSKDGQPRNAVKVIWAVGSLLLCTILPSPVAFTSLVSAAGVPTITAYALIACTFPHFLISSARPIWRVVGRFFLTPGKFRHARWNLGKWSRPFTLIALVWNLYAAGVLFSPIYFPVTNQTFNYACVIFGAITIFAVLCWWFMPEEEWLRTKRIAAVIEVNSWIRCSGPLLWRSMCSASCRGHFFHFSLIVLSCNSHHVNIYSWVSVMNTS